MSRVSFLKGKQKECINLAYKKKSDWGSIAAICGVCPRTLRDWRREKYQMNYEGLKKLHTILKVPIPRGIKILPEHWSIYKAGRIGAKRRYEIYGNPGTPKGRSKGGKTTCERFKRNPEYAKKLDFIVRKNVNHPKKSALLAEFIGIVLGDGGISQYQVTISLNSKTDRKYGNFVKKLIHKLFNISCAVRDAKKHTLQVVATGKNLIEFLQKCGLDKGDKVARQVDVPHWIMRNNKLMRNCLRGLIDTDGGIYFHTHVTKGIRYRHIGLCFTNHSVALLNSVHKMLLTHGIIAKNNRRNHVHIYNRNEIKKYMDIIGSHNQKHLDKFNSYKDSKSF